MSIVSMAIVPCSHPVCSMAIYKYSRLVPKSGASPFSMSNACTSLQEGMVRCLVLESTISNVHASLKVHLSYFGSLSKEVVRLLDNPIGTGRIVSLLFSIEKGTL